MAPREPQSHRTQEQEVDEEGAGDHAAAAEDEHHEEVGRAAPEGVFFEHPAIAIREDHVEDEVEAEGPEEQEGRGQAP